MGMEVHCPEKQRHGSASTRTAAEWHCCAQQGYGIALRREASEKDSYEEQRKGDEPKSNGYEMQANAMAPLNSASHRHCWEKRRHGQEAMGREWLGQSGATFCTATAKNSNRKIHF